MNLMSYYPQFKLSFSHPFGSLYRDPQEQHVVRLTDLPQVSDGVRQFLSQFRHRPSQKPLLEPNHVQVEGPELALLFEHCSHPFLIEQLGEPMDVNRFLDYSCSIVKAISLLHQQQRTHLGLQPLNILLSAGQDIALLTGLYPYSLSIDERGTLFLEPEKTKYLYTAPEQTGRLVAVVGPPADLYSLGVIFFEMLAGHRPFDFSDSLELIHHHLTVPPPQTLHQDPRVPPTLAKLVDKLLEKNPKDRYGNAQLLLSDLLRCRRSWQRKGKLPDLQFDRNQQQPIFRLASRLYGVETQQKLLVQGFKRAAAGSVEVAQIKGDAGLGKSSLVTLLTDVVKEKGGLIVSGRFEKLHQDTPYRCLREALNQLVTHLLTKDEKKTFRWKKIIPDQLGDNLPVLLELLPDLRLIIPCSAVATKLEPVESQHRMGYCLQQFVGCFSHFRIPLVLFFDNFHFADFASVLAIQQLTTDFHSHHLLLLTAFRDQGRPPRNHLKTFWQKVEKSEVSVIEIRVTPWGQEELKELLHDSFRTDQDFSDLGRLLKEKTDGNPYYVKQLLSLWVEQGGVQFDPEEGRWVWVVETLHKVSQSTDVVELLAAKIKLLPEEQIKTLKWAACIGFQFDPDTLQQSLSLKQESFQRAIEGLRHHGLIYPESDGTTGKIRFQFLHNRIYIAAQSFWGHQELKEAHYQVGWVMLEHPNLDAHVDWITQTVNQLNQSIELIQAPEERLQVSKLNLAAGNAARELGAFETAWGYFTQAMELLSPDSWETEYPLTKEIYVRRAEAEYFTGNTQAFIPIFQLLYQNLKTDAEREEVTNIKLNLYTKAGDYKQAVEIGVAAINQFSQEKIPPHISEVAVIAQVAMQEMRSVLNSQRLEGLTSLEPMDDPQQMALVKLMSTLMPAAFTVRQPLWIYLTVKIVESSLKHGMCINSVNGFMSYAVLLCSGFEDYQQGFLAGKMALELNRAFHEPSQSATLNFLFGAYIVHWKQPAKESLEILAFAAEAGVHSGNFIAASDALSFWAMNLVCVGIPLDNLDVELNTYRDVAKQAQNADLEHTFEVVRLLLCLLSPQAEAVDLKLIEAEALQSQLEQSRNQRPLQFYYFTLAMLHFLRGNHSIALKWILKSDHTLRNYGQLGVTEHYFYYSLIIMANYPAMSLDERKQYWDILKINREKLSKLATACPINFLAQYRLVCAEMSKESGNFMGTIDLYDQAIEAARKQEQAQVSGLANELAARYYLSKRKTTIAAAYISEAYTSFRKWGALAKLDLLQKDLAGLIDLPSVRAEPDRFARAEDSFDLDSLSRVLQAISLETDSAALIQRVLKVFMENAGAQKGYFLVSTDGHFQVQAEGDSSRKPPVKPCAYLYEESDEYAHSVISFVIRTRKQLTLGNATSESAFGYDPYIEKAQPKSILALPIQVHGRMLGILYLENNLQTHAFTAKTVEVLTLLVSQVAVTFENSNLLAHLNQTTLELKQAKRELKAKINRLEQQIKSFRASSENKS